MFHSNVRLKILFLVASPLAVSSLFPPPLVYLETFSNNLMEGKSIRISCVAPRAFAGAHFSLFMVGQTQPVQTSPAAQTEHQVTFLLENVTASCTGLYRCQYGLLNGSHLQSSTLSYTVEIAVEAFSSSRSPATAPPRTDCQDPSWALFAALSVTSALLLVMILVVAMPTIRRFEQRRRQKKKELDSCWTQARCFTTELSFDNGTFAFSPKMNQDAAENHDAQTSSSSASRATRLGPGGSCSDHQPDFFTFRATE